jgi:hypothetical protein
LQQLFQNDALFNETMEKIESIYDDEKNFAGYPRNPDKQLEFYTFNQWGREREPLGVTAHDVTSYLKELKTKKDDFSWIPIIAMDTSDKTQKLLKFFRKLCSVLQFFENGSFKPGSYLYNDSEKKFLSAQLNGHILRIESTQPGSAANHTSLANFFDTTVYALFKTAGIGAFGQKDLREGKIKKTTLLEPEERYKKQRVFIYDSTDAHYDILLHRDIIKILKK